MYRLHGAIHAYGGTVSARDTADSVITALTPAAWYRNATDVVSSGGFASIWADYASSDKGLVLPGVAGNSASTPDSVPLSITGDIDIAVRVSLVDWTPSNINALVHKWVGGGQLSFSLEVQAAGTIAFYTTADGSTARSSISTVAPTVSNGDAIWLRVTRDADVGVAFYTAADSSTLPSSWVQLGDVVATANEGIFDSTAPVYFGIHGGGAATPLSGKIYRAIIKDGIDGTTVFDADFSAQAIGAGSFTESSSNAATVTINASGASPAHIGKARDLLQGTGTNQPAYAAGVFTFDGADNYMKASAFTLAQPEWVVIVGTMVAWTANDYIVDGNSVVTMGLFQGNVTPDVALTAGNTTNFNSGMVLGARKILSAVWNGASSTIKVNGGTAATGDCGAGNGGGLTLCANGAGSGWASMKVEEVVVFPIAPSVAEESSVITALNNALTVF